MLDVKGIGTLLFLSLLYAILQEKAVTQESWVLPRLSKLFQMAKTVLCKRIGL